MSAGKRPIDRLGEALEAFNLAEVNEHWRSLDDDERRMLAGSKHPLDRALVDLATFDADHFRARLAASDTKEAKAMMADAQMPLLIDMVWSQVLQANNKGEGISPELTGALVGTLIAVARHPRHLRKMFFAHVMTSGTLREAEPPKDSATREAWEAKKRRFLREVGAPPKRRGRKPSQAGNS